jgi:hypothetical protein
MRRTLFLQFVPILVYYMGYGAFQVLYGDGTYLGVSDGASSQDIGLCDLRIPRRVTKGPHSGPWALTVPLGALWRYCRAHRL